MASNQHGMLWGSPTAGQHTLPAIVEGAPAHAYTHTHTQSLARNSTYTYDGAPTLTSAGSMLSSSSSLDLTQEDITIAALLTASAASKLPAPVRRSMSPSTHTGYGQPASRGASLSPPPRAQQHMRLAVAPRSQSQSPSGLASPSPAPDGTISPVALAREVVAQVATLPKATRLRLAAMTGQGVLPMSPTASASSPPLRASGGVHLPAITPRTGSTGHAAASERTSASRRGHASPMMNMRNAAAAATYTLPYAGLLSPINSASDPMKPGTALSGDMTASAAEWMQQALSGPRSVDGSSVGSISDRPAWNDSFTKAGSLSAGKVLRVGKRGTLPLRSLNDKRPRNDVLMDRVPIEETIAALLQSHDPNLKARAIRMQLEDMARLQHLASIKAAKKELRDKYTFRGRVRTAAASMSPLRQRTVQRPAQATSNAGRATKPTQAAPHGALSPLPAPSGGATPANVSPTVSLFMSKAQGSPPGTAASTTSVNRIDHAVLSPAPPILSSTLFAHSATRSSAPTSASGSPGLAKASAPVSPGLREPLTSPQPFVTFTPNTAVPTGALIDSFVNAASLLASSGALPQQVVQEIDRHLRGKADAPRSTLAAAEQPVVVPVAAIAPQPTHASAPALAPAPADATAFASSAPVPASTGPAVASEEQATQATGDTVPAAEFAPSTSALPPIKEYSQVFEEPDHDTAEQAMRTATDLLAAVLDRVCSEAQPATAAIVDAVAAPDDSATVEGETAAIETEHAPQQPVPTEEAPAASQDVSHDDSTATPPAAGPTAIEEPPAPLMASEAAPPSADATEQVTQVPEQPPVPASEDVSTPSAAEQASTSTPAAVVAAPVDVAPPASNANEPDLETEVAAAVNALHLERLRKFANENSPPMLKSLDAAWEKFGNEPFKIWRTVEKRFPGSTEKYTADIDTVAREAVLELRRRKLEERRPGTGVISAEPSFAYSVREHSSVASATDEPSMLMVIANNAPLPVAAITCTAAEIITTLQSKPMPPVPALDTCMVEVENDAYAAVRPATSGGMESEVPTESRRLGSLTYSPAEIYQRLPENEGEVKPASTASSESSAPVAHIVLTTGVPEIPSLASAVDALRKLSAQQWEFLVYPSRMKKPHPALVVVYGVLCVLFGQQTTWKTAVALTKDPQLRSKLIYVSSIPPLEEDADEAVRSRTQRQNSGLNLLAAASAAPNSRARDVTESEVAAGTGVSGPVSRVVADAVFPDLAVQPHMLSLARRLLNKRPDIRAEVRTISLVISPSDTTGKPVSVPFAALIALAEWEVSYILHMTVRQRISRLRKARSSGVPSPSGPQ